jgi:NTE family protein
VATGAEAQYIGGAGIQEVNPVSAQPRTAFVFSGGSSLGAIQVGMLKALLAHGEAPDFVVGSSVGAINAAYFAGDPTPRGAAGLEQLWRGLKRRDIFPVSAVSSLVRLLSGHGHIVEPSGLERLIDQHLPYKDLEQAKLPCHIIATDMLRGIELRLSKGPVVSALLASAAIPGVFPPVKLSDRFAIDGGVANHTPISAAIDLGAKRLIVLPTGYSCTLHEPPRRAIEAALHGLNMLIAGQLANAVRRYEGVADIRVVPPLCPLAVSPYDFAAVGGLIERAEASTREWLAHGAKLVNGVPHQLPPHTHERVADPYGPRTL